MVPTPRFSGLLFYAASPGAEVDEDAELLRR